MAQTSAAAAAPRRKPIPKGQLLINGQWRDASDGTTMPTFDPTTEEKITEVAKGSPADAEEAVDAASKSFEEGPWSHMHHEERAKILFRIADLLDERADDFELRELMDMGMPYHDFRTIIMPTCSGLFRFFGGLAMQMSGRYRQSYEANIRIMTRREPLGMPQEVVAPTRGGAWKCAPSGGTFPARPLH